MYLINYTTLYPQLVDKSNHLSLDDCDIREFFLEFG